MPAFHFIFGLRPQSEPFHLVYFLSLESCRQLHPNAVINFHYRELPWGPWWERIAPYLQLRPITGPVAGFDPARYQNTSEGRSIAQAGHTYAHEADFLRLQILLAEGGCYADIDTLFVRPYPQRFFEHEFAIGEETAFTDERGLLRPSLCNAVMFARPGARYVAAWLQHMGEVFDGTWNRHSCFAAARLWEEMPESVTLLPRPYFYRYGWTRREIATLFEQLDDRPHDDLYSIHLWAHLWWSETRRDFTDFHAGLVTPEYLRQAETTFAVLARRFLPELGANP
jgi:hypothetical protein